MSLLNFFFFFSFLVSCETVTVFKDFAMSTVSLSVFSLFSQSFPFFSSFSSFSSLSSGKSTILIGNSFPSIELSLELELELHSELLLDRASFFNCFPVFVEKVLNFRFDLLRLRL